ncbi:Phenylalanyl tRNA synthetase alpha chain B [Fasciola hepatica]|uniref:phenylalanine--tRNA ligase n=1 Tax=Fasciola hepatica TaxID=6192 RepID=A0A4E0QVV5_FASHE|nr:Phenylalanyl tRNA synthetase alpha chain B [Fasciola hepatica]
MMFITLYLLFSKFQSMNIQGVLLSELEKCGELSSLQLAKELNVDHQLVVGGLKSLQSLGDAVNVEDTLQQDLCSAIKDSGSTVPEGIRNELRKRKLVTEIVNGVNHAGILRLSSINRVAMATNQGYHKPSVSSFLKCSGAWNTARFKPYNFKALGSSLPSGHLHPLLRVRSEFAKILADMGFSEMPTNNYVECGFWNFDSLFQPQQHPARDTHDTFFVSEPAKTNLTQSVPESYIERVRLVHSRGSFGSRGYQSDWLLSEAEKNLLRTHTTAVSARMLYRLAQQNPVVPVRYFSIDRVFRNETLDATHLAEFHQVEGLVADYGLSLGHLKAVIRAFFGKLGLTQLRFKPAYNPYTEPSMEIFAYHPGEHVFAYPIIGPKGCKICSSALASVGFKFSCFSVNYDIQENGSDLGTKKFSLIMKGRTSCKNGGSDEIISDHLCYLLGKQLFCLLSKLSVSFNLSHFLQRRRQGL